MLRHFDQSCNHDSSQWWLLLIYIFSFTIAPIGMEYLCILVFLFLLKSINDMYACSVSLYWVKEIACVLHNCHHHHYQLQYNQRAGWKVVKCPFFDQTTDSLSDSCSSSLGCLSCCPMKKKEPDQQSVKTTWPGHHTENPFFIREVMGEVTTRIVLLSTSVCA